MNHQYTLKEIHNYNRVVERIKKLKDAKVRVVGEISFGSKIFPLYQIIVGKGKHKILLSAGTHGDEPAGVQILLRFLEKEIKKYTDKFTFYVYPCLNPVGFNYNKHTNYQGINLNRDFYYKESKEAKILKRALEDGPKEYLLAFDFHEDPYFGGFYMYETYDNKKLRIGNKIIKEVSKYCKIATQKTLYKDINDGGVVYYPHNTRNPVYKEGNSFDAYTFNYYSDHIIIVEFPLGPMMKLIKLGTAVLKTALKNI